jgi:hypothetical protein
MLPTLKDGNAERSPSRKMTIRPRMNGDNTPLDFMKSKDKNSHEGTEHHLKLKKSDE